MEQKRQISFEPVSHTYTDETGLVYTSATTLIGFYKEPFNKRYWSMYTALKNNGFKVRPTDDKKGIWVNNTYRTLDSLYNHPINNYEVELLVKKWQHITEKSCARGNKTHDYLEDSINASKDDLQGLTNNKIVPNLSSKLSSVGLDVQLTCKHDLDKTTLKDTFPIIYNRLLEYINNGCTIYAEKRIYSTTFQIAGMIDVLIVKGKMFAILDWKTNKDEIMFQSGYFKKINIGGNWVKSTNYILTGTKLKYPIHTLDECKGMIYTLQLSLYAYIMELWGYKLVKNGLEIFHIRPVKTQYGEEIESTRLLKIKYKKAEIHRLLHHHLHTRVKKDDDSNDNNFPIKFGIYGN